MVDILNDDSEFTNANIYLEPPPVDELTDEDSGDEEGGGTIDNLSGRQLGMAATATIHYVDGSHTIGEEQLNDQVSNVYRIRI